jgi:nitroreductase
MDPDPADRVHHLMCTRHSARAPFDPQWHVTPRELAYLIEAARWSPTAHNMQNFQLVVVEDVRVLQELGRIVAPVTPLFIAENYRQLSWTEDELVARQTGLLGTKFPSSWRTDDPFKAPAHESRALDELIAGAPTVIVVIFDESTRAPASEHDRLGMISLGCVLENMWLIAQALQLAMQVVSTFAGEHVEPEVRRVLAVPDPWRIAFALRVGHALPESTTSPRVRRDVPRFVHRDRF